MTTSYPKCSTGMTAARDYAEGDGMDNEGKEVGTKYGLHVLEKDNMVRWKQKRRKARFSFLSRENAKERTYR